MAFQSFLYCTDLLRLWCLKVFLLSFLNFRYSFFIFKFIPFQVVKYVFKVRALLKIVMQEALYFSLF